MQKQKALFLSLGVAVGFAGAVSASERAREDATATESGVAAPAVDFKVIGPGLVVVTLNGQQVQMKMNTQVSVEDAVKQSGSVERYLFDLRMRNVPVMDHNGEKVYQGSTVLGNYADLLGSKNPRAAVPFADLADPTLADFEDHLQWVERTRGGETQRAYMTTKIINDPSMIVSDRARHIAQVPSIIYKGQRVFLDTAVFPEDMGPQTTR